MKKILLILSAFFYINSYSQDMISVKLVNNVKEKFEYEIDLSIVSYSNYISAVNKDYELVKRYEGISILKMKDMNIWIILKRYGNIIIFEYTDKNPLI